VPANILRQELVHHKICCWQNYPYIKGGYTFNTLATDRAKEILSRPVENTIFFAGEAMDQGESQGTVESALKSGHETATLLMETFRSEKQD
jgi:monoamine oxidase